MESKINYDVTEFRKKNIVLLNTLSIQQRFISHQVQLPCRGGEGMGASSTHFSESPKLDTSSKCRTQQRN